MASEGLYHSRGPGQPTACNPNRQPILCFSSLWLLPAVCRGICHGDVYAHNVMADEQGQTVLCDYGAPVWCACCVYMIGQLHDRPIAAPP
jgi:serine/threonine protein kinase